MPNRNLTIFKKLSEEELRHYAEYARKNYLTGDRINPLWHPALRMECERMNLEYVQSQIDDGGFLT